MTGISIQEVLAKMADAGDRPFRIGFVRAKGKNAGAIKEVTCYYGAPNPKPRRNAAAGTGTKRKPRATHLESGTVPLTEVATRRMMTPMISHIILFNNKPVFH